MCVYNPPEILHILPSPPVTMAPVPVPLKDDQVSHLWLDTVEEEELIAALPGRPEYRDVLG